MSTESTSAASRAPVRQLLRRLFRCGATGAFLVVVALQLALFAAPWFWIGEILQDLRWHCGLASSATALALLPVRAPRRASLALLLAAFHLWPEARLSWPSESADAAAPRVVLVTANVLFSNGNQAALLDALRATNPDVLALQELTPPLRRLLERELTELPHRAFSPAEAWHEEGAGLGLFSRTPLREVRSLGLTVSYAPGLEAALDTPAGALRLRVVHLQRPGKPWRLAQRAAGLAHLEPLEWNTRDVLLGDLNLTPSSPRFSQLLERTQLRDSLVGHGRQPSYWRFPRLPRTLGVPIDHALHGCALRAATREVFELPGSDHGGVRVELVDVGASP
ncbi:MAG: endonuclease/exonuclease/phosphatase family protein [Planctomycetes bacterium]|nr:endonuclease/exonuclease/phosphatase family protein [Planctomycetota bacterium]